MRCCRTIGWLVASTLTASALGAQATSSPRSALLLGGGLDPLASDGSAFRPGVALQGGYERRLGSSPFALRLEANYWRHSSRFDGILDGQPLPSVARIVTIGGAGLLATYQFRQAGWLRPYALGGVGFQQLSLRNETDWAQGERGATKVVYAPPDRRNSVSLSGGLGVTVPLGATSLFVEGRATVLPNGMARGSRGPIQGVLFPIIVGIRF